MNILSLILGLLPIGEEIASIFIHNPNSQHKFTAVVSTVDALTPVLSQLGQVAATSAASPAVDATVTATPASTTPAGFVPAGVPSAHSN